MRDSFVHIIKELQGSDSVSQATIELKGPLHSIDYTNDITRKDFGRNFEKHQHSSFGDQVCNQFGTILEDYARHQKIHFQIG